MNFSLGLTLNETPNTSDGSMMVDQKPNGWRAEQPKLSFKSGFNFDDLDLEGRDNTIQFCPAPMTSRGDNSFQGLAHCLTPCYKQKASLRQTVRQED
jgi:hypothetical protein